MSRIRSLALSALLPSALLLPVCVPAAPLPTDTVLAVERESTFGSMRMRASGLVAEGCPPHIVATRRLSRDIVMQVQPAEACLADDGGDGTLFELRSDPLGRAAAGEVYRLRMEARADPDGPLRTVAFALAEASPVRATIRPETGFWWAERGGEHDAGVSGFGVLVEVQDDTVAVSVSGYNELGAPEWTMGAAPLDGRISRIPLGRLTGGQGPHGRFRGPQRADDGGQLHVEWLSAGRAVFWFERRQADGSLELTPVSMVRFGFSADPGGQWLGRWVLAAEQDGHDMPPPRLIDFVTHAVAGDRVVLHGGNGERLECTLDATRPQSPPDACQLQVHEGRVLVFDDVALGRMRSSLMPITLLRIER